MCGKHQFGKPPHGAWGGRVSTFAFDSVFSIENGTIVPRLNNNQIHNEPEISFPSGEDVQKALVAAEEATYKWNIATDELSWSQNAEGILGCALTNIRSGRLFASLLDGDNFTTRYDAVMNTKTRDSGSGVAYRIEYLFRSEGRANPKTIWVEDQGRWHAGADGTPMVVYGTIRRIDERHRREQHLNFIGNCDPLTGMMNRGRMTEALGEAITAAKREDTQCAFAIAAVNNLPVVNEAYGFEVADEVIVALGRRLRQVMRTGDGIARYSGDKFGIILNDCNESELVTAMERFLAAVRDNVIETQHGPVWAMLSIGAVCLPRDVGDTNTATSRAEEALNEARHLPSDGYLIYEASERRRNERTLNARCATEIVKCLKEDRFKLAFQPIVDATTGQVVMHEALLRMADSESGELITASHLVPISERLGLVRLIDRSVMQMIIKTLHSYPDANLSMNVSGVTASDPRWFGQIIEILAANHSVCNRLTVEITETAALSDVASTRRFVEKLRNAGCSVAIDDFGAGFTSFRNLRDLPVNMIKLDGNFSGDLRSNSENQYIVKSLIDLAGKFHMKTVAEWIENEEDADAMRSWGVDYLQGHLLGSASLIPPWQKSEAAHFTITAPKIETIAMLPDPTPIMAEEAIEAKIEPIESKEIKPQTHQTQATAMPELDLNFADIDASIANLRSSLDELKAYFPIAPEKANRDAA